MTKISRREWPARPFSAKSIRNSFPLEPPNWVLSDRYLTDKQLSVGAPKEINLGTGLSIFRSKNITPVNEVGVTRFFRR